MNKIRNYPDHYKDKQESERLVRMINQYWTAKGYPRFTAWVEESVVDKPNGQRERIFVVRSNIKQRCIP